LSILRNKLCSFVFEYSLQMCYLYPLYGYRKISAPATSSGTLSLCKITSLSSPKKKRYCFHICPFVCLRPLSRAAEPFSAGCSKIRLASRLESAPLSQHTDQCQLSVVVGRLLILLLDSTTTNEKCSHCNSTFGRLFFVNGQSIILTLCCVNFILQILVGPTCPAKV